MNEQILKKAMDQHPTGFLLGVSKHGASAFFWTGQEASESVVASNILSGLIHNLTSRGLLTREECIEIVNKHSRMIN
jgi:hypothetical protein